MLYNITTICWPYEKHIYFRIGVALTTLEKVVYQEKVVSVELSKAYWRPQSVVYKVDYLVLRTLSSSFVLLNIKRCLSQYKSYLLSLLKRLKSL